MENQTEIAIYIAYGCFALGIFSTATLFFMFGFRKKMAQKTELIQNLELETKLVIFKAASEAEELERERIARNLHDEINLMLVVHKHVLEKHAFNIESNEFNLDEFYQEIGSIEKIREAITACATKLVPAFLLNNGLPTMIEDHMRHINHAGKLKARCNILLNEDISTILGKQEELNIYRICLELINNLLKHALPTAVTITISNVNGGLFLQIDHDGKKISTEEVEILMLKGSGLGLNSIKARCLILNAAIHYSDNLDGPAITLLVPSSTAT